MTRRPLTSNERGLLALAIASVADDRCRRALLAQLDGLTVVGGLPLFIDLEPAERVDATCFPGRNNPIEGTVRSADGKPIGGINVWIQDGALTGLEGYTYEDDAPTEFPDPELVRIHDPRSTHPR